MIIFRTTLLLSILLLGCSWSAVAAPPTAEQTTSSELSDLPEAAVLNSWIEAMKQRRRGPFKRIRWFCNDGTILPPVPYACREHGGGKQHGEWSEQVKQLRRHNYLIANLFADLSQSRFYADPDWDDQLKQLILEQFLREADDGWIFRRARYYRGAIQAEDENWHGRSLLLGLLQQADFQERHFLLLREAVRFIPHGQDTPALLAMRQLAQTIAARDPGFSSLRIKLHSQPEAKDAASVRLYAESGVEEQQGDYWQLAKLIDQVTRPQNDLFREALRLQISQDPQLIKILSGELGEFAELPTAVRFARVSQLLVQIRTELGQSQDTNRQLQMLDLSLQLELDLYRTANQLLEKLPTAPRRQRLAWIELGVNALYGTGMLSRREFTSLTDSLQTLVQSPVSVASYQRELNQLARMTRWAENRLRYYFASPVNKLARLDGAFRDYVPERLRASPLLPISRLIDSLQIDSQQLRGVKQRLFGTPVSGLQPLNPGLARGRLELVSDPRTHSFSADGIYLLPETVAELPPVAGILTRGSGNALSHIQLLARNLGIPNIAISAQLQAQLAKHQGEIIVVAVSPGGVVRIEADSEQWQQVFKQQQQQPDFLIEPDLQKLDLQKLDIVRLEQLRAVDSGRIAGPKGANLGELKHRYQDLVPDALVIPFGRFRQLLEQTPGPDRGTLFDWMRSNYQQLVAAPNAVAQQLFLARLREQIVAAPLAAEFLAELRDALSATFGPDGSYGVFVRSDTNVEDLPNFTGAGLNKTVPHVVGFDNILQAIRSVWASPFTDRAFSWRQAHMPAPEHLYVSVLLMASVPADKSGVMATIDLATGNRDYLHVAVNEGVGGAVNGQRAEEVLINQQNGKIRLLAQASAEQKRILLPQGGVEKVAALAPEQLLKAAELMSLRQMAAVLPTRFPALHNSDGSSRPADIEFGFLGGKFVLFQIRPLVESKRAKKALQLQQLDAGLSRTATLVDLNQVPAGEPP